MSELAMPTGNMPQTASEGVHRPKLDARPSAATAIIFIGLLVAGLTFTIYSLTRDVSDVGGEPLAVGAFILLGVALLIALGFEFVNGFHDTANAVATVIYTHSLPANVAVLWSGTFNFLGVLASSGAVAYGIVSLLPVELILQVGSNTGFAMIFALLIAAIMWNLATWSLGLPASSSHTLIGSIMGVGLANQLMAGSGGASGVDWAQAGGVFKALLLSPIVGFVASYLLLKAMKLLVKNKALYQEPNVSAPPPTWIRGLLILTCTGVSFFHGSNDGQKGMGLIMLILIGALPTAYALNRAMPDSATPAFVASMNRAHDVFAQHAPGVAAPSPDAAKATVQQALRDRSFDTPALNAAMAVLSSDLAGQVQHDGAVNKVPAGAVQNVRNEMYMASETAKQMMSKTSNADDKKVLGEYRKNLDAGTKFIPLWVKVAVAIALGLGTMVGWKRIVVTVGEKIGKTHLTYGQGAAAELVASACIGLADGYGLPVSTTHVLSSGVAGTMLANGSGLQLSTLRNIGLAWVLTLPAAMLLSGLLYALFRSVL